MARRPVIRRTAPAEAPVEAAAVEPEAPKRGPGRPPKVEAVRVKVIVPNLWTSTGKFLKLETATLPRSEAEWLEGREQVVMMG